MKSSDNSTNLSESTNQSKYILDIFNKYSNVHKNYDSEKKERCTYLNEIPKKNGNIFDSPYTNNNGKKSSPKKQVNVPIQIKKFHCNGVKDNGNLSKFN